MNAKSTDTSIENKSTMIPNIAGKDRIKLEPEIPPEGKRLLQYLNSVMPRLLELRKSFEKALKGRKLPNNIDAIQKALSALDDNNGRLELPSPISRLDLLLIWGDPQARLIRSIVFSGLEIKFFPDDFKIPSARFFNLYDTECPEGFLKTFDLFEKIEKFLGNDLELGYISFSHYGLSSYLFNDNDPPQNALILHKHGHHELNYVPYAEYGSDAVTYGLMYDYYRKAFSTTVYHGDGCINPYDNPLEPFIEKFTEIWKYWSFNGLAGYYDDMEDAELINHLTVPGKHGYKYDGLLDQLKLHTVACFLGAYFEENATAKHTIPANDRSRYKNFFRGKELEELQQQFPSSYIFRKTLPVTPIALDKFGGGDYAAIDDFVEFAESVAKLHGDIHKKNPYREMFSEDNYDELRESFIEKPIPLMLECDDLRKYVIKTPIYKKKDRAALFKLLDSTIEKIYSFAMEMTLKGNEGYGFVVALVFWEHCTDGGLSKMSLNLLNSLSESLCPAFIKKTAALHSVVRQDAYIPT